MVDDRDFVIVEMLARSVRRELAQVAFMVATQPRESASGTFRFRWSAASARFSLVRCRTAPECAFPSRRGAQEVWGNPPARLRGGLCGGSQVSAWSLVSRKGALCPTGGIQNALFRDPDLPECAFP